jgi:GMP synthase (glutamine-hydrolysing)
MSFEPFDHMSNLKILVVDGNTRETDAAHIAAGGNPTGEHYANVLRSLRGEVECSVLHPARPGGAALPTGAALAAFDGIAWTGSALNVYRDQPEVRAQIELSRAAFESGVPQFGSCWGLQVAAAAVGGTVRVNPLGRELGVARQIALTKAGAAHPMFAGKRTPFDAIAVHMDEISALPPSSSILAGNSVSRVQAAEIRHKEGVFWGTQYHPEYDLNEIATVILRYGERLVQAELFADMAALKAYVDDLRSLHADPGRQDIATRHGIGDDVLDPRRRRHELVQWLRLQVIAHK